MGAWTAILRLVLFTVCCSSAHEAPAKELGPWLVFQEHHPCEEFESQVAEPSGWTLEVCSDVWKMWTTSLVRKDAPRYFSDPRPFYPIGVQQRRRGFPCQVQFMFVNDGAGSRVMRILAAWILAEEMGCDLITPPEVEAAGAPLYCHEMVRSEDENPRGTSPDDKSAHCVLVDWLSYFNLHESFAATNLGNGTDVKTVRRHEVFTDLGEAMDDFFRQGGFESPPWHYWHFKLSAMTGAQSFIAGNWNQRRRKVVRRVLESFRSNFRRFPRLWYDSEPECQFSPSRVDVAIHVRLGDRVAEDDGNSLDTYFDLLEDFMTTVSSALSRMGQEPPFFHIFSEVVSPCPSSDGGYFEEFPRWPVNEDQIQACLTAETPVECPEKEAGALECKPVLPGIFAVRDKDLMLHVGLDARNDLSCMIQADAILTGCSAFGQIAGVLNDGVKFFPVGCEGDLTDPHYKMLPPLAVLEHGRLWVPMSGSWTDPKVWSNYLMENALSTLVAGNA